MRGEGDMPKFVKHFISWIQTFLSIKNLFLHCITSLSRGRVPFKKGPGFPELEVGNSDLSPG